MNKRNYFVTIVWGKDNPDNKNDYNFESEAEREAFIAGVYEAKNRQGIDGLDLSVAQLGYFNVKSGEERYEKRIKAQSDSATGS